MSLGNALKNSLKLLIIIFTSFSSNCPSLSFNLLKVVTKFKVAILSIMVNNYILFNMVIILGKVFLTTLPFQMFTVYRSIWPIVCHGIYDATSEHRARSSLPCVDFNHCTRSY